MRWPVPPDWPNAACSRQVLCRPHRWHVQRMGEGPAILLLHGAGGSTHSFRDLVPMLAETHEVVAVDLPGQGFTQLGARHRCGLPSMAADLELLITQLGVRPAAIVGHSAGGAIALRLAEMLGQDGGAAPAVIGINAALSQFKGLAGALFPAMAKALALAPFTASVVSRATGNEQRIASLIAGTGSTLGPEGVALYRRLAADQGHVDGTLLMMAQWSLDALMADLPRLGPRTLLLAGAQDRTVPPSVSRAAAARMPDARAVILEGLGHLAHEEDPARIVAEITAFLAPGRTLQT